MGKLRESQQESLYKKKKKMCCYRKHEHFDREKSPLILCNSLMNYWNEEERIELCTGEVRRGVMWWKIGVWRLNGETCVARKIGATY